MSHFAIEYDEPIVIWTFKGLIEDSDKNLSLAKQTFGTGINFYQQSGRREIIWLNDTLELENLGPALQNWLDTELNNNIIKHQLSGKLAFIEPINTHGKECIRLYIAGARYYFRKARLDFEFAVFKNPKDAKHWLLEPSHVLSVA